MSTAPLIDCGACGRPGTVTPSPDGCGDCLMCGAGGTPIVRKALHLAGADYRGPGRRSAVEAACRDVQLSLPAGPKAEDQLAANFTIRDIGARFRVRFRSAHSLEDCPLCPQGPVKITSATTWACEACGVSGNAVSLAALFAFGTDYASAAEPEDTVGLKYLREKGRLAHL